MQLGQARMVSEECRWYEKKKGDEKEVYESVPQSKYMLKFQKRMSACPSQCIRYAYGEAPLLPVSPSVARKYVGSETRKCSACGSPQLFEFQILPQAISLLCPDGGMDFCSLLVYSCSASCPEGWKECVVAIPDPDIVAAEGNCSAPAGPR